MNELVKRWKTAVIVVTTLLVLIGVLLLGCEHDKAPTRTLTADGKPIVGLSCHEPTCPDCSSVTVDLPGGPEVAPVTLTRTRGGEAPAGPATVYGQLVVKPNGSWPMGSYTGVEPTGRKLTVRIDGPEKTSTRFSEYSGVFIEDGNTRQMTCYAFAAD